MKPPSDPGLDGFDVNEHYCLTMARALAMNVVDSRVASFDGQTAIVVTRFDRRDGPLEMPVRLHQEDLCQAMGVPPDRKYESEGGPGIPAVLALIRSASDTPLEDVSRVLEALALNWVIGGSDAHAKNFAFLITPGSVVRLAPLYDVISVLPYPQLAGEREIRLAMRIGREYEMWKIRRRQWAKLAELCALDTDEVLGLVRDVVESVPAANTHAHEELARDGLDGPLLTSLKERIAQRAEECLTGLGV